MSIRLVRMPTDATRRMRSPSFKVAPDASQVNALLEVEGIQLVMEAIPRNLLGGIAGALLLTICVSLGDPRSMRIFYALCWFAAIAALLVRGIMIARSYEKSLGSLEAMYASARRLTANGVACAVLWGLLGWIFLPHVADQAATLIIVGLVMVLVGGAGAQAGYRPFVRAFSIALTSTFAAGLLYLGGVFHILMGLAFALLCVVTNWFARSQEEALRRQILLRLEMDDLRRQAEVARGDADKANRAKTLFLASASHDLRQPITAIGMLVSLLQDRITHPEVRCITNRLESAVKAMEGLLVGVLDLSRLEAESVAPTFRAVNFDVLMESVVIQEREAAERKGLEFRYRGKSAWVWSDPVILERILRNLIANAVRYTNRGGILVAVRTKGRDGLLVQVWDTGVGIPVEHCEEVFEPFFQIGNPGRDREKGLGLGLAIARRLARLLSTEIRVQSRVNSGSCFWLQLIRCEASEVRRQDRVFGESPLLGQRIWLVENDSLLREALEMRLLAWGAEVKAWPDSVGPKLRLDAGDVPDGLVSDFRLGSENCISLIDIVQRKAKGCIRIIVISGDEGVARSALDAYPTIVFLDKPFLGEALLPILQRNVIAE